MKMNPQLCLAALLTLAICASALERYVSPQTLVSGSKTPDSLMLINDGSISFKKVLTRNKVTKWTQTVGGIPVYGSVLTTHNDNIGSIKRMQGFLSQSISTVSTVPDISSNDALTLLKAAWNHSDVESELFFRVDAPELQILQTNIGQKELVWKVCYFVDWKSSDGRRSAPGPVPSYIFGLVNADGSNVIEKTWNNLQHARVRAITGNAKTGKEYHSIEVEKTSQTCKHRDEARRIEVFDIWDKTQISSQTTSEFQCNKARRRNWDLFRRSGGYSPRNEAFLHATRFVDMWTEFMGNDVKPYRTSTSFLRFYTHYSLRYENAFFDGDSFKFGDGEKVFYPLTSLDIVCHEIGHAITQWHGGRLEYRKESGAMNEAYSDILGETCDIHYKNRTEGLIGEDIIRPGSWLGTAMRNMCEPSQARARSLDNYSQYRDNIDVHYTSGIYNKAWCTLKNRRGWNYIMAFKVFTDANLLYWNPTSTMHCGACGVEAAANDRGYSKADVTAAFHAVGVDCNRCR